MAQISCSVFVDVGWMDGVPDNPSSVSNKRFAPTLAGLRQECPLFVACLFASTDLRIFATNDPFPGPSRYG